MNNLDKQMFEHIRNLPDDLRGIIFCIYQKVHSYTASKALHLSVWKYNQRKDVLLKHLNCYRFYLQHKIKCDEILSYLTDYQRRVFLDLLRDPFQKSHMVAKKYGVTSSAIRNLIHRCFLKLLNKEAGSEYCKWLYEQRSIVFGCRKKKVMKC